MSSNSSSNRVEAFIIRLGLGDPFIFIQKYFLLILLIILAHHFLMGLNGVLDVIIKISGLIYAASLALSMIMMCWFYARSPESKSPYKQLAYFFVFLCATLTIVVPALFIFL